MKKLNTIIIGGGPSGIMTAISASQAGKRVVLVEKNKSLGKKLLLTGKGRCNLTTNKTIPEIVDAFGKKGRFLYSALSQFSNRQLIRFFESRGVKTKVERGQRVFPQSNQAQDVLNCLAYELEKLKVPVYYQTKVVKITNSEGGFKLYLKSKNNLWCKKLVLATGGASYPGTGSTGDGYRFAKDLGHQIKTLKPALAPLFVKDKKIRALAGLDLNNIELMIKTNQKTIITRFGDMIFTHQGISGPIVLETSKHVYDLTQNQEPVVAHIDLKPAITRNQLTKRIFREIHQNPKKHFQNLLKKLLPMSLIKYTVNQVKIDPHQVSHTLDKSQVKKVVDFLKDFKFKIDGVAPIETAIITSGGVDPHQIDSRSMESSIQPKLYFAGEIIALDGPTGGYNLQKAFSTGWLAGKSL